MRQLITILSLFVSVVSFSQINSDENNLEDSGKNEFKLQEQNRYQQVHKPDYSTAYRILSNQVKVDPTNAEYRYYLGFTIDRLNSCDGNCIAQTKKEMTIKASEQFEEINRLQPKYEGEINLPDPYSKLTSIWASLAVAYLNRKLIDSAKWAFVEGKKRGGFIESVLEFNRQLLNNCDKNSILITRGDNFIFPIWYLQTIENLRNDITVVDGNLISAPWYTKYLKNECNLKISLSDTQIDTIVYKRWKTQKIEIINPKDITQKLSWELRPTLGNLILKQDRILLDIFRQNFFNRPMYFLQLSKSSENLFLSDYLINEGLVARVSNKPVINKNVTELVLQRLKNYSIENLKTDDIKNSRDAISILNYFREAYITNISYLGLQSKFALAKQLLDEMNEKFALDKLPFKSEAQAGLYEDLVRTVNFYNH